jgi:hypothetical protein
MPFTWMSLTESGRALEVAKVAMGVCRQSKYLRCGAKLSSPKETIKTRVIHAIEGVDRWFGAPKGFAGHGKQQGFERRLEPQSGCLFKGLASRRRAHRQPEA